ncbi:MAG: hypothetical protein H8E44_44685 [Planctomycetes bacterium]|nr:hypothetical protein [Planctomycetota bacterium]MBL7038248.1 hypothetical protein [Pirellulaceae bacterium]
MSRLMHATAGAAALLLTFVFAAKPVLGMGQERFGPALEHISRSSDWPNGVEDVLRHPSCVYWNWVNGNEHAYYGGGIGTINQLIDAFAQVDLARHDVILRPGSPSARSFQGQLTPYTVEFHVPAGLYFHHAREHAQTGLYPLTPRLIVNIGQDHAEQLDELKIPANVTLRAMTHPIEAAVAQLGAGDRSLCLRAISVLGESGDSSAPITTALEKALQEPDEYVHGAAQKALEKIKQANAPETRPLRDKVAAYLAKHPQTARVPDAQQLLDTLNRIDGEYARGFTATGTMVKPSLSGRQQLFEWKLTMGDDQLILQQRAVDAADQAPFVGRIEYTIYTGPEFMASIHRGRLWVDGELQDTSASVSFEPVGRTYDLLVGRVLWPLGRGFSRSIERITEIKTAPDGTLIVAADAPKVGLEVHWELRVDPKADFIVRTAKRFRRDDLEPSYIASNRGILCASDRCIAHTAAWQEGPWGEPMSIAVKSVSAEPDMKLIRSTKDYLENAEGRGAQVLRSR